MLLQKYNPNWQYDFEDLKETLDGALKGLNCHIEHVGSTAVPGLDAKPIIDIDIIYSSQAQFVGIKAALERIGYHHKGDQGIAGREVFKRSGLVPHPLLDGIRHHLYVCPQHSPALLRHLLTRNFLRKNDWARLQYQQMKYELAAEAEQDQKTYAALKEVHVNDFLDFIVEKEMEQMAAEG